MNHERSGRFDMKVVLLKDVKGQGKRDQIIDVSDGYARNFLLPRGFAAEATGAVLNDIKTKEASRAHKIELERAAAREIASRLETVSVAIRVKSGGASGGGRMYGSVTTKEIAEQLAAQHGIDVDRRRIELDEPIRQYGTYRIKVKLYTDVTGQITVTVTEA